ncbi:putative pectate lyase H [Rhexocercosporidium sp. MPI-PUGE-AT-0058]|nr:putative pectate lyase H [Rhexocercosporidium sp. MPI-PUGE-AT-0058]
MKFSTVQFAALGLVLVVSAAPSITRRDCDLDLPSNSTGAAILDTNVNAKASTTKKSSKPKSTKTPKASATDDAGFDEAATTTKASQATATDSSDTSETGSAGSALPSSGAPATTVIPTIGNGGGSSGGKVPASSGTSVLRAAQTIAAGGSFDGGMVMFDRGVSCTGQAEGSDSDAVFQIEKGGSISNVIIGPNQIEGIHCQGACTLTNVWWAAVCEDAFTIKNQAAGDTTKIVGGGAFGAEDKVLQHNGAGTLDVSGFTVVKFGKFYRACGNCATSAERHVIMSDITATDGDILAGVNGNFGDTAKITNSKLSGVKSVCTNFKGVPKGSEPTEVSEGADGKTCIFGSDVVSS